MDMGYDVLSAAFLQGIRAPQQSPSFNPAMGSAHGCIPPSTHIPSMPSSYASLQLAAAAAIQQSPVSSDPAGRLTWGHVALAFGFILLDAAFSLGFGLKVESSLIIASLRCVFQLAMVANILAKVFATDDPWVVALIVLCLNLLGTIEVIVNKSKRRYNTMFPTVFISLLASTIPISIIGTKYAMSSDPFWTPMQYVPVMGMLCGNTISAILVSVSYTLRELQENRDRIEMYLAFGASRMEACRPIAVEALRLALTPIINQMSVLGIIAIPGMMTGAILGGASVHEAAKLQMIIMFMISASSGMASMFTTIATLAYIVDSDHRVRGERIRESGGNWMGGKMRAGVGKIVDGLRRVISWRGSRAGGHSKSPTSASADERAPLLS